MADAVLDSSAVLAVLNGEQGASVVAAVLDGALVSSVNFAEVFGKLIERGVASADARRAIEAIDLNVVDYDLPLAERTGELIVGTRELGLSLGDRACLALAEREQAPAYTADRRWSKARIGVQIRMIR